MVETSDKTWSTGERNGKPLQYFCLENLMNSNEKKDRTLKDELPRSVGTQYGTGEISRDQWRNKPERMKRWSQAKTIPTCGCD